MYLIPTTHMYRAHGKALVLSKNRGGIFSWLLIRLYPAGCTKMYIPDRADPELGQRRPGCLPPLGLACHAKDQRPAGSGLALRPLFPNSRLARLTFQVDPDEIPRV